MQCQYIVSTAPKVKYRWQSTFDAVRYRLSFLCLFTEQPDWLKVPSEQAVLATLVHQKFSNQQREAVPWVFAFIHITLNGPILLRSLGAFIQKFLASTNREAADAVKKAKMQQTIGALKTTYNLSDERAPFCSLRFLAPTKENATTC